MLKKMKIRFFGSSDCRDCLALFVILEKIQVNYEYIDGHDEREFVQDFCDEQNIDELPHLQFIDENNKVVAEHIGEMKEKEFTAYLKKYFPTY